MTVQLIVSISVEEQNDCENERKTNGIQIHLYIQGTDDNHWQGDDFREMNMNERLANVQQNHQKIKKHLHK